MKAKAEIFNNIPKEVKVAPSVLDAFDLLKSPKEDLKLTGGTKIISILHGKENEKEIKYALRRLVRSCGANHPDIRSGYFATLTSMLKCFENISLSEILILMKKELHASGSSKSEIGDVALGQLLVCGAVFRSGLMLKSATDEQTEIINLFFSASTKKSYLSAVAYQILLNFINTLNKEQFTSIIWTNIKKTFKKNISEHSLDSLYFLTIINKKFPEVVKIRKLIGVESIFCEDTVDVICEKLMSGIDFNSVNHPIYKEIGTTVANSSFLELFWARIDSQLVKHNRNRELVALNMLTTILNNMQENFHLLPELLSKNFFKLFMEWFKGLQTASKIRNKRDDEEDHKIIIKKEKELLNSLAKALKSEKVENKIRVETLKKLLFHPGDMNFSEITGTSIIKSIMADLNADSVKKIAKIYKSVLLNTTKKVGKDGVERHWYNNERLKAAEGLSYLVIHDAVKDDTKFKLTQMEVLMCLGFFKIGGDQSVATNTELSASIKSCFYRCFNTKYSNVDNLVEVLSSLCSFICEKLENEQIKGKINKQFPKENMECWELLIEICKTIETNKNKTKIDKVFLILLYQLGLFLFSEPKYVDISTSSIKELKSCYMHYKNGNKKKKKKAKVGEIVDEEPEWVEVLLEVLLSILSAESSVLRSVVQCVFRLLYEYLTPSAIGQIISVLDPENESNPLTDNEDSGNGSDVEEDNNPESDNERKNESNESEGSESESEDDDDDMKTPDQLRIAIHKALGVAATQSDTESIDADMIDEEEGKKLDTALAEAFIQFGGGKMKKSKKERKDKKTLSDFRIRVLDLIDIYLEKDPSMDITLGMIAPLIRCLEFCIQETGFNELENRLRKTIKNLSKIKKFALSEEVTVGILCDYLKNITEKGSRSHFMYQALGDIITQCGTFIIHCAQKVDSNTKSFKKSMKELIDIFKDLMQNFFRNRNCSLPIIFFHSVLQTDWEGIYELIPIVIENTFSSDVRHFRRNEGLELLTGFYRSLKRIKPSTKDLLQKITNIESLIDNTIREVLNTKEFSAKNNFFLTLKKLINIMKMYHESCQVKSQMDFKSLLDFISNNKNLVTVTNTINDIRQNSQNSKIIKKKKKQKKRKAELVNGHGEPKMKKNKT